MSLIEKIIDHSINYPNKTAFIFNNESISYKDFLGDIKKVAENLKKDGAKEKDLILIRSENIYEFICCYFAIQIIIVLWQISQMMQAKTMKILSF